MHASRSEDDRAAYLPQAGLFSKRIQAGYAAQTGHRPIVYTPIGFTGVHKYAAMWSGGRARPHLSVLSLGLSGITHLGVDMNLHNAAGIHFGFFQPWSKVNSWAYWRHPLLLDASLLAVFKMYAKLRYRLIPYIYSAAEVAVRTGLPIVRAMPLAYPDDADAIPLENQYMFGDDFLVAVFTDQVYLPAGEWIDYWTGDPYTGPVQLTYQAKAPSGGPLFVRAGAIVPMWPEMDWIGQKPLDRIELHLFPGGDRQFSLYEDDGVTLGYLRSESAVTTISCAQERHGITVEIGARHGQFRHMAEQRSWDVFVHTRDKPLAVKVNGEEWRETSGVRKEPAPSSWAFQRRSGLLRLLIKEAEANASSPLRLELMYAVEKETRQAGQKTALSGKSGGHSRSMPGELEKDIEIGLETGDSPKALSALEQWWSARIAGGRSPEDIREHWLYMNGLFIRSLERKGRTLSEAIGEAHAYLFTFDPAGEADAAFDSLSRIAQLMIEYDALHRGRTNEIVRRVTDIIAQELDQELSLHEVADRLHLNSSYLSRKFKREVGVPFSDFVLEKKMELAKELLLSGCTVNATSERTGFKDTSYFIRVFRKYWGVTPGEMKP
jgi:AraC-like DNA-binding protein